MELTEPDLFRRHPEIQGRTYRLSPAGGAGFREGEEVLLRFSGGVLGAFRNRVLVGTIARPTRGLTDAVGEAGGALCVRVHRVHPHSGAADVSVVV